MRGFKAKALRRLAKEMMGDSGRTYMTEPVRGQQGPTHGKVHILPSGVPTVVHIINPIVRVEKWFRLYKKMKKELT